MSITVGALYKQFSDLKGSDMKLLVGSSDFDDNTSIPLANIAKYSGPYYLDISIWTAKQYGENFTAMLPDSSREKVTDAAGIKNNNQGNENEQPQLAAIPMGVSIFDIDKKEEV